MSLLAPAALGLISLAIPLVVLYMLRSRRRRVDVPSVALWAAEEQNVSAALPWQRLTITAALILQLLALVLFAILLSRPFFREETLLGPHTVMVIDTSGSMAMAGRLDAAKARADALAGDASEAQLISVVEAGPRPRVLVAFSRDPEAVRTAVASLEAGGGSEDLAGALRLARGLTTPDRPTTVLFLTDGGFENVLEEPVADATHVRFDAVDDNVAITAFGTGVVGEGGPRVFVEITSFSNRPESGTAELTVDGLRAATIEYELDAGASTREIVPIDAGPGQEVEVRLVETADANSLDDRSALILSGGADLSATVLGEGSPFLDALLGSVEGIRPAVGEPPDIVVYDGGDASLVDRPSWIIDPAVPPPGLTIEGRIDNPVVTFQRPSEPILDGLDFSDLVVGEAQIPVGAGWLTLVGAGDVPLIMLGEVNGHRVVYFTFDLVRSNLPVQVTFPILGARILDWLGGSRISTVATAAAGTPLPLATPVGGSASIVFPDGTERTIGSDVITFTDTTEPGLYAVQYLDAEGAAAGSVVAARQFVSAESAGSSRSILTTGRAATTPEEGTLLREWGPTILVVLLIVVLIEWWVAYGRPRPGRTVERVDRSGFGRAA
jgi:hypothetical protein